MLPVTNIGNVIHGKFKIIAEDLYEENLRWLSVVDDLGTFYRMTLISASENTIILPVFSTALVNNPIDIVLENDSQNINYVCYTTHSPLAVAFETQIRKSNYKLIHLFENVLKYCDFLKHCHESDPPVYINYIDCRRLQVEIGSQNREYITNSLESFSFKEVTKAKLDLWKTIGLSNLVHPDILNNGQASFATDIFALSNLVYFTIFKKIFNRDDYQSNKKQESFTYSPEKIPGQSFKDLEKLLRSQIAHILIMHPDRISNTLLSLMSRSLFDIRSYTSLAEYKEDIKKIIDEFHPKGKSSSAQAQTNKALSDEKKGFASIAGMRDLKDQLKNEVLDLITNPEEYIKHKVQIPNGLLLYGPPGTGKTYFAEKLGEEAGMTFIKIIPSDLASTYIHGSQEKIAELFNRAKEQAPCILYFDEIDAIAHKRGNSSSTHYDKEVNELLSQLSNLGEHKVFVIGSTNCPESIDNALLRPGRIEKHIFVGLPDQEAREEIFLYYLKPVPSIGEIDVKILSEKTPGRTPSHIKLIVNEASRSAIKKAKKNKEKNAYITMQDLFVQIEKYQGLADYSPQQYDFFGESNETRNKKTKVIGFGGSQQ